MKRESEERNKNLTEMKRESEERKANIRLPLLSMMFLMIKFVAVIFQIYKFGTLALNK